MSGQEIPGGRVGRWPGGVNNVLPAQDLQRQRSPAVRGARNIDFSDTGKPRRRRGYTLKDTGVCHSLWSSRELGFALMVQDSALVLLRVVDGVEQISPIATVLSARRMSYALMNGEAYFSNGLQKSKVTAAGQLVPWGVENPGGQPALAPVTDGGLTAGRYQVAITFMDAAGEESGSEQAAVVDVVEGGGISLAGIPQPTESGVVVRVYASPANGDILYHAKSLPIGTLTTTISRSDITEAGRALETQFHDRVPPADFLAAYRGRIYMATGKVLQYTAALRYGLVKRHENYFMFPDNVKGVMPTLDGIYVGTEKQTYFLGGDDPKDMKQRLVESHGVVPHSTSMVDGAAFNDEKVPTIPLPVWWNTNSELMRGDPNGVLAHLTLDRLALPSFSAGATMQREVNGVSQIVSTMQGAGSVARAASQDTAVIEVIRNGVKI